MNDPEISIVMPVYNARAYLEETVASIQAQSFSNFEVICVDDGSTDDSVPFLGHVMESDSRFQLLRQCNAGAGAARNYGFQHVSGKYTIFLDSDDLFSPEMLANLYEAAEANLADIAACNYTKFFLDGSQRRIEGVHLGWLPKRKMVFSWEDCPNKIMSIVSPVPWNKLYRSDFIREHGLRFEEISSTNDITFTSLSLVMAKKIAAVPQYLVHYRVGHSGTITSAKAGKLNNVRIAVQSAARQAALLPHWEQVCLSALNFVIDNYLFSLTHYIADFSNSEAAAFYQMVHETFNQPDFSGISEKEFLYAPQFYQFLTVQKWNYEEMRKLRTRHLIVSLTTYPKRIHLIPQVLESLWNQTRQPDEILLWLAEEQFPGKESDLPEQLLSLVNENKLTIRWCDDLKPHKKYFYTFQEYPEDLVVTVDDDLTYSPNTLESLYSGYLLYPDAVSTVRTHLIVVEEEGNILPYDYWIQETDACLYQPSMQLLATNGAGVLHPVWRYWRGTFDKQAILDHCLWADDLWLKAMQLISDIPVVLVRSFEQLQYLPDSQEEGLHVHNVRQHQNDVQLSNVIRWLDKTLEPDLLRQKLICPEFGKRILGIQAISEHLDIDRRQSRSRAVLTQRKLEDIENRRTQLQIKQELTQQNLNQTRQKFYQTQDNLNQTKRKLYRTQETLNLTRQKLTRAKENTPISRQLKNIGAALRQRRAQGGGLLSFAFKYLIYLLAWIPETILAALMYYLQNGGRAFLKQIARKLLGKK